MARINSGLDSGGEDEQRRELENRRYYEYHGTIGEYAEGAGTIDNYEDISDEGPGSSRSKAFLADSLGLVTSFPLPKAARFKFEGGMIFDMKGLRKTDILK